MSALRQLWLSSRPLSWVNTAYPFGAAYLLAVGQLDLTFWIGTLFFLVPYNFAMYGINDVFDYESDLRNPRKGGVEGAVLNPRLHRATLWLAILSCLPFVVYLLWVGSIASDVVLAVSLFAVAAYSWRGLRFKEVPFLDSVTSSTHFVSPAVFALVLAGVHFDLRLWFILAAYFAWGMASHAFGAVQDISADRQAGLSSIATVLGAARTSRFALAGYALAGVFLLLAALPQSMPAGWVAVFPATGAVFVPRSGQPGLLIAASLAVLPYLAMVWPFRSLADADCEQANRGWRKFLTINFVVGAYVTVLLILSALS